MKATRIFFLLAISLALIFPAGLAVACPSHLMCSNFTQMDKRADCNFVNSQSLTQTEKQQVICGLWDEEYGYPTYQPPNSSLIQANLTMQADQISNTRFLLAGKITVFLILNYFLFSLTKSLYFKKCLPALSQT